jgi:DNA-binding Lrp family transcriptional regulator
VDGKDFRLLVALNEDARQSFQALGRKVSLSAPAVGDRLRRLEERGILQGYWVSVDPSVFGRRDLLAAFEGEWSREDAVKVLDAPDVAWVAWKVDGSLTVQLWPRDTKRAIAALSKFLHREPSWQGVAHSGWTGNLSKLDWRVLDVLIGDPRASVERISTATRLSPKTVRKHVAGLVGSEAIFVVSRLGFLTDSGELVYHLVVSGTAPFSELRHVLGDAVLIHETAEPPMKYLFCRADSLGELTAKRHALGKLPRVTAAQLSLNREMIIGTNFVHRLVRERIASR